jgi:hypothetical protein
MVIRKVLEFFGNYKTFRGILNNMPWMGLQTHQSDKKSQKNGLQQFMNADKSRVKINLE